MNSHKTGMNNAERVLKFTMPCRWFRTTAHYVWKLFFNHKDYWKDQMCLHQGDYIHILAKVCLILLWNQIYYNYPDVVLLFVKSIPDPEMIAMQSYPCNNHRGGECEIVSTVGTFTKSINHNTKRTIVISNGRTLRRLQFPSDLMPFCCVFGCCAKNYLKNKSLCLQNRKVNPQIAHSTRVSNYPRHMVLSCNRETYYSPRAFELFAMFLFQEFSYLLYSRKKTNFPHINIIQTHLPFFVSEQPKRKQNEKILTFAWIFKVIISLSSWADG